MCHSNPVRWAIYMVVAAALAHAQPYSPSWQKVGTSAVDTGLAGPAGGPARQVWFSQQGSELFVRTMRGQVFRTANLETWTAAATEAVRRDVPEEPLPATYPEKQAAIRSGNGRLYAFGVYLYASEDGGLSWTNLTAFAGRAIIGENVRDVAVSPADPLLVAVANDSGVWASHDGGLSWSGLNEGLPNLPVRGLIAQNRMEVEGIGVVRYDRRKGWAAYPEEIRDQLMLGALSVKFGEAITAYAAVGDWWYAGSVSGRVWTSADAGGHWTIAAVQAAGAVQRFTVEAEAPRIAFLAAMGQGAHLFRTVNGGLTWQDITGALRDAPAHGVAVDRAGGVVYAATDRGVFQSRMDVNVLGAPSPWLNVSGGLPTGSVVEDVRLDPGGRVLRAAVDGFGMYVTAVALGGTARLVNPADWSTRAAAPGGLVSALGISVETAVANGIQFPVLARSAAESQIQVPFGTEVRELALELNRSVTATLTVKAVAPAIFVDRGGKPLLLNPETKMLLDGDEASPPRSLVQVLVTGLGKVKPDWPTGTPAPFANIPTVVAEVRAYLNGVEVEVTKATLAPGYVGMYLVEIRTPALFDEGVQDFYLAAGGESSNHVPIAVSY